ncbi:MAG: PASTA domain-containing protein [Bacteroidales bacterium]|nr:PASTA domain-containing protein [Bacteroidales bacterium]
MAEKKDRWIVKNLVAAVVYVAALLVIVAVGLGLITRHGKTVTAPDFTNLTVREAQKLASESHVQVKVVDSVFVRRLAGGVVYRQQPKAGSEVKKGRSIFLTINSVVPRKVVMPNLYGYSVSEARAELQNRGLNLGKLTYVKDIATNTVLSQSCEGKEVKAGALVVSGSNIELKVGVSSDENSTTVPRLIGMKYVRAVDALHDRYLNTGRVRFDENVKTYADSVNAVVYKQDALGEKKPLGTSVNIYLTLDTAKLPAE